MATQAQIDANRRNARKSTGPQSAEGKKVVANNAVKHGLCSEDAVIRGEDPADFATFADRIRMGLEETDVLYDVLLVERIIRLEWKLLRLPRLEKRAMDLVIGDAEDADGALLAAITDEAGMVSKLDRYEMRLSRELRACKRQLRESRRMHTNREVHQAYCNGWNAGVREEAASQNRPAPVTPPQALPPVVIEAVEEVETEAETEAETESAEQSQFSDNSWQGEGLAAPVGGNAEPSPGSTSLVAGHPHPEYRERDTSHAA